MSNNKPSFEKYTLAFKDLSLMLKERCDSELESTADESKKITFYRWLEPGE